MSSSQQETPSSLSHAEQQRVVNLQSFKKGFPIQEPLNPGEAGAKSFDGGGPSMEQGVPAQAYIDRAIEAAEARLRELSSQQVTKGTFWGGVATTIAVILAVLAFGGDRFDSGMSASQIVSQVREENAKVAAAIEARQVSVDARQDAKLVEIDGKLDTLIVSVDKIAMRLDGEKPE